MSYDLLVKAFIIAIAMAAGSASTLYFKMKPDNVVEQAAEAVIATQTGMDIDLSPDAVVVVSTKAS